MKLLFPFLFLSLTLARYLYIRHWRKCQRGYYHGHDAIYGGP